MIIKIKFLGAEAEINKDYKWKCKDGSVEKYLNSTKREFRTPNNPIPELREAERVVDECGAEIISKTKEDGDDSERKFAEDGRIY